MKSVALEENKNSNLLFSYFKGLVVSLIASFGLIILLALGIGWLPVIENYIYIGTLIIKVLCSAIGASVAIRGGEHGLLKGLIFGLLYICLAFIVFSFLAGGFDFDMKTMLDALVCAISSGIVGVIKVNKG